MTRKGSVVPHFDHLDPRNAIMPLMMVLKLCDTDGSEMVLNDQNIMLHIISIALS